MTQQPVNDGNTFNENEHPYEPIWGLDANNKLESVKDYLPDWMPEETPKEIAAAAARPITISDDGELPF